MRLEFLKVSLVFAVCLFYSCSQEKPFNERLYNTVTTINEKCPKMLDSETRIDGVEYKEPNTLLYKYTLVNVLKQNVDTHQFYLALWPGLLSTIKVSAEMKELRENNTLVQYAYNDKLNNPIYTFTIKPENYNKHE